jgi:hypothetical protein
VTIQQEYQPPQQSENSGHDEEFDFSANQNRNNQFMKEYVSSSTEQQYGYVDSNQYQSSSGNFE